MAQQMWYETARPFMTTMGVAVAEMRSPSGKYPKDAEHFGTYIHWNMDMRACAGGRGAAVAPPGRREGPLRR